MAKTRIYNIKDELLHVFKIRTVPHNLDIDGMIEDMCMADDESHIRMIGLFLYRCLLHDKRCSDSFNIYWFTQIMLPQKMVFLHFRGDVSLDRQTGNNSP